MAWSGVEDGMVECTSSYYGELVIVDESWVVC